MRIPSLLKISLVGLTGLTLVQAQGVDSSGISNIKDTSATALGGTRAEAGTTDSTDALHRSIWLSELSGMKVRDNRDQESGTIDNVLVDLSHGTIPYVIVNTRQGFLGLGAKSAAVPSEHFRRSPDRNYLTLDLAKDQLSTFPQTDAKSKDKEEWNRLIQDYRRSQGMGEPIRNSIVDAARSVVTLLRGDDILNKSIFNTANERLGQVKDFLVQLDKGQALLASIQPVGSDATIAIPPLLFQNTPAGENLQVNTTLDRLNSAPSINLARSNLSDELASLYRYFSLQPSAALASMLQETGSALQRASDRVYTRNRADSESDRVVSRDQPYNESDNRNRTDTSSSSTRGYSSDQATSDRTSGSDTYRARSRSDSPSSSQGNQVRGDDRISFPSGSQPAERQVQTRVSQAQSLLWSDQVKGKEVRNYQGKTLGRIEDLVLDLDNDAVTHAVVAQGGVLGIGSKLTSVPLSLLRAGENASFFLMDLSENELNRAPQLEKSTWRQGSRQQWLQNVNDYYRNIFPRMQDSASRLAASNPQKSLGYALLSDFLGKPVQYAAGGSAGEIRDIRLDLEQGRLLNVLVSPDSDPKYWRSYSVQEITANGPDHYFLDSDQTSRGRINDSNNRDDTSRQPVRGLESERNR